MNYSVKQSVIFWVGFVLLFFISQHVTAQITPGDAGNFITTWQSDNQGSSEDDEITIPTDPSGTYDYDVYWEDVNDAGNNGTILNITGNLTIDFGTAGTYRVEILGTFPRILFLNADDPQKILTIEQWGDIAWSSMDNAFSGATNLTLTASDAPDLSSVIGMNNMFRGATSFKLVDDATMNNWEVGNVQFFNNMFNAAGEFNGDLSNWNTGSAKQTSSMFYNNFVFNSDLSGWDVLDVTQMSGMFFNNYEFNADLSEWDVDNVQNMEAMFRGNLTFNSDLSGWEVGNVTNMNFMFQDALVFESDLSGWDVSKVEKFDGTFLKAEAFNSDISGWTTEAATTMKMMFLNAESFNKDLGDWDIEDVTAMDQMLNGSGLSEENYDQTLIGWQGGTVENTVTLGADGLNYCDALEERQDLIDNSGWTFNGDSPSISCIAVYEPDGNNILYVNIDVDTEAAGYEPTGGSWENAVPQLRDALRWADEEWDGSNPPVQFWVADGVYLPTSVDTARTATFRLVDDVEIYGGFDGGESSLGTRNWENNVTILSGDIDGDDTTTNGVVIDIDNISGSNSYHVVTGNSTDNTAILNGFTITGGNADGSFDSNNIYGSGMYNENSSPTLANITFSGNSAYSGGGMYNINESSPSLTTVTFFGNSADEGFDEGLGGGMHNDESSPTLNNVTFSGNNANNGGGMYNREDSSPTLANVIIWNNQAAGDSDTPSASIYNDDSESTPSISHSLIANSGGSSNWNSDVGNDGGNNLDVDPQFVDADDPNGDDDLFGTDDDGLALQNVSPAINMGTNTPFESGGIAEGVTTDLAGNDRIYDGNVDIVDMGAYEFQGDPVLPEADDNRILVANTESYTFTPSDFGQTDNSYFLVIEDLSVSGTLQLDGSDVNTNDEIPVSDIDNGDLIYTPPSGGAYGYGLDAFDFRIKDDVGNESETAYTINLDVGAQSVELTGGEGWRFLGNPSDGDSFNELLGPIWTKEIAGSDNPGSLLPNVLNLNQSEYHWEAPGNMGDDTSPGQPFIVYVYSDDNNDGTPEGFPKTLASGDNWLPLNGDFAFSDLGYDESEDNPDNFYLVANPHPMAINFCEMFDEESVNIANSTVAWDPSVNSGNGDYISLSCSVEDVFIAPFQAFWIRTTGDNPELEIPESAYLEGTADGYFKQIERSAKSQKDFADLGKGNIDARSDGFLMTLNVSSGQQQDQAFATTTRILFSDEGTDKLDEFDAPKLSPAGLANRWLSFYSMDEDHHSYALQSLPLDFDEKIRIPLDIQTTESGRFTLEWILPEAHVFSGRTFLRDNQSGEVIELREGGSYHFEIASDQTSKVSGEQRSAKSFKDFADLEQGNNAPRFELLITAAGVDGMTELGAVPENFTLAQNYPNPFNPTTVINYQLPVSSEVRLEVYDMLGRNVATLVNEQVSAGRHTVNFDASGLSSGVYLYRLAAGNTIMTRKLTILK